MSGAVVKRTPSSSPNAITSRGRTSAAPVAARASSSAFAAAMLLITPCADSFIVAPRRSEKQEVSRPPCVRRSVDGTTRGRAQLFLGRDGSGGGGGSRTRGPSKAPASMIVSKCEPSIIAGAPGSDTSDAGVRPRTFPMPSIHTSSPASSIQALTSSAALPHAGDRKVRSR